jgi:hypothetical protein
MNAKLSNDNQSLRGFVLSISAIHAVPGIIVVGLNQSPA